MVNATLQPRDSRKCDPLPFRFLNFFWSKSAIHTELLGNFKNLYALCLYEVNSDMLYIYDRLYICDMLYIYDRLYICDMLYICDRLYICDIISLFFRNLIYSTDGS
jgi:hypothetical protein